MKKFHFVVPACSPRRIRPMADLLAGAALLFLPRISFAVPPDVKVDPLNFKPPHAKRVTLSNGVIVYLLEDHELPLLELNIRMKASPADVASLDAIDFVGSVWRAGGTKKRTPEMLNQELEQMAASVETGADYEAFSVSLSCLSKDTARGLEIFADVLFNPAFRADQLSLAKAKAIEGLRRKNDTPAQIARRAFRDQIFGKDHVYAHEPTEKGVQRVSAADLALAHKHVVVPDQAIVAAAGDFKEAEMIASLEKLFADWKPAGRVVPPYDYAVHFSTPATAFFVQKDANQSRITIGRLGPARHHPDHFALELTDYILGGGGPSRLFGEIRSRLGLAYVVGSFFMEMKGPGLIGVGCQTKTGSTVAAVRAIRSELDKFSKGPLLDQEIRLAKDATVNSFVFGFDSPWSVANGRAANEFYGFSEDYPDTYTDRIEALSKETLQVAAKKYYAKDSMKIMVVGNEPKLDGPVSDLGPVVKIPVEDIP